MKANTGHPGVPGVHGPAWQVAQAWHSFLLRQMEEDQGSRPSQTLVLKKHQRNGIPAVVTPISPFVLRCILYADTFWAYSFFFFFFPLPNQPCWVPICMDY